MTNVGDEVLTTLGSVIRILDYKAAILKLAMPGPFISEIIISSVYKSNGTGSFFLHQEDTRWVGRFTPSSHKENTKELPLQSKYKYIKNTMATGIAQKSCKALFPLWSLKKKDILKLIT